jgi:hypothetical protein
MKLDRGEVEALLAVTKANGASLTLPTESIAALCRLALEVMDAPEATVKWEPGVGIALERGRVSCDLIRQRVRLVRVSDGDACMGEKAHES